MKPNKKFLNSCLRCFLVLGFLLSLSPLRAEEPPTEENPFGNLEVPPPPPVDPDFLEEDNLDELSNNLDGLTPPPPPPVAPNLPNASNPAPVRSNPPPMPRPTPSAPPVRRAQTPPTAPLIPANKKTSSAPKLADYLELDSAVKGLEVKNFDLPDKDLKDVVTLISKWTGKNFILDSKVRGKITILGPSQVSLQEAYQAFLTALDANGLTTVQSGKFIRIIESAEARRAPVQTYAGEYAPKDDQYITRIFQLKYINADEVQREFRDLVTRQGKLFAYEPTNSVIITDTGSNIARIQGILDSLDVKTFETTLHILPVVNNSAKTVAEMLDEIYSDDKSKKGNSRTFRKSQLERSRGGGVISKVIPDETTNSLLVLANKAGFETLKSLVARLDVKASSGKIRVYYCEHAKAEDLANTLASLAGGGSSPGRSSSRPSGSSASGASGVSTATSSSRGPISAELEGGVKITSDAATNSLVITANNNDYKTLKKVIKKLDIPRLQVFVETAILEVNMSNSTKAGMNLTVAGAGKAFAGGFVGDSESLLSFFGNGSPPEGATIPFSAGNAVSGDINIGGTETTITGLGTLNGVLNLLTKDANTTVLSTPQIIALDNEKAELQVLDDTPVVASTVLAGGAGGAAAIPTVNVDRLKTGINIKLTPHINAASRTIRMEIEQKIDSARDDGDVPLAIRNSQKALTSRVTNTSVVVKDGDYLMMGGLMSDKVDESVSKVPLIGDIPILGWLFKSKTFRTIKTNLIILLRPKVIGTSLMAGTVIKENLQKRHEFIDDNFGGKDELGPKVEEIEKRVDQQLGQSSDEPFDKYRNNEVDDEG